MLTDEYVVVVDQLKSTQVSRCPLWRNRSFDPSA